MADATVDVFIRHQAYLEAYKNGQTEESAGITDEIAAVIILLMNKLGIERLSDLNKRDLTKFVTEVNQKVAAVFGKVAAFTVEALRKFADTELRVLTGIFNGIETPRKLGPRNGDTLIAQAINAPVAGLGEPVSAMLAGVVANALADIRKLLMRSAADNLTIAETIRLIVGTRSIKFKDGLLPKIGRNIASNLETAIQHTSAWLSHTLGAIVSDRYQWVSVLDAGTTDICRGRNGNIYVYGQGPRPPAHYRCRSTTIPLLVNEPQPVPTYFAWLQRQPHAILVDILGPKRTNAFEGGNLSATELGPFGGIKSISLGDYRGKLSRMLGNE